MKSFASVAAKKCWKKTKTKNNIFGPKASSKQVRLFCFLRQPWGKSKGKGQQEIQWLFPPSLQLHSFHCIHFYFCSFLNLNQYFSYLTISDNDFDIRKYHQQIVNDFTLDLSFIFTLIPFYLIYWKMLSKPAVNSFEEIVFTCLILFCNLYFICVFVLSKYCTIFIIYIHNSFLIIFIYTLLL